MHVSRFIGRLILATSLAIAAEPGLDPNVAAALNRISAASMQGHVSFLASDLLEGRATPSRGLDIAAEYVAAQFRRAGLEPLGDDGYFQTAKFLTFEPDKTGLKLEVEAGGTRLRANPDDLTIQLTGALSLTDAPVHIFSDLAEMEKLKHDDVRNTVITIYVRGGFDRDTFRLYGAARRLHPELLLAVGPGAGRQRRAQLISADQRSSETPTIGLREGEIVDAIEHARGDAADMKLTITAGAPKETAVTLRNVAGILRGSDPWLKDSYVLVTGHYDHMGMKDKGDGDRIYNGANDDASGTASVMEIAAALAGLSPKPKRSIVFIALFGEELGLLGSQYYGRHPLVPLAKTIADVNLEHMGRTDAPEGKQLASASFTGYDYSDVPSIFQKAGEQVGVKVYKDDKRSDAFFARSDNQALADLGVPAHTLCVAFEFPDYHGVGDEWQKIDYDNMAKVDRMVALGLLMLTDSDHVPKWNATDGKAKRYMDAWNALHAEATH